MHEIVLVQAEPEELVEQGASFAVSTGSGGPSMFYNSKSVQCYDIVHRLIKDLMYKFV